ncbi:hypothetical protein BJ508DRAFT_325013 [Ascobolus immersus RN42]|uniref:F-box domain-containing protein n=1 Tax=Ascobolus immersus RN42 TaxID=1160509 RepID=A0A3N4IBN3_ASCIM|nr:hypothetical protein BJ508DRAFT_325013 [Ascobolus immersus RN42]
MPQFRKLLSLPVELRLEIYSQCTAFSLLQLSHTCSALHHEINKYPAIIKNTYGYWDPKAYESRSTDSSYERWRRASAHHKRPVEYEAGFAGMAFNLHLVSWLRDEEEYILFLRQARSWRGPEVLPDVEPPLIRPGKPNRRRRIRFLLL